LHIIGMALEASSGLVICANKWDLVKDVFDPRRFRLSINRRMRFAPWAPFVVVSALEGTGLEELIREVLASGEQRKRRVPTGELNAILRGAVARRPPPMAGKKRLKLLYVTQPETSPPTFVFFVNDAALVSATYKRYLENSLRAVFGYRGTGLRLLFRSRGGA